MALRVDRLQPVRVARRGCRRPIVFLPANGGLPTIASNPPRPPLEHLGELDLPVERHDRLRGRRAVLVDQPPPVPRPRPPRPRSASSTRFASRSFGFAPAKNAATTRSPNSRTWPSSACASSHMSRSAAVGHVLAGLADLPPAARPPARRARRSGSPRSPARPSFQWNALDLPPRQADQRVAVAQGVVEERQRRAPAPASPATATSSPGRRRPGCGRRRRGSAGRRAGARRRPRPRRAGSPAARRGRAHASTSASASWRHASTRNAPEPIAGSQTFSSRICSGRGAPPASPRRRSRIGSSVVRTIGSVSSRGV